jgi:uncharacterized protein
MPAAQSVSYSAAFYKKELSREGFFVFLGCFTAEAGRRTRIPAMEIINNKRLFRFEAALPGGEIATLEYRWLKGNMVLMHTLVPASGRGKGAGSILVKFVLDYIRGNHLKMIVYCPFVTKYIKDHPEYAELVVEVKR